MKYWCVSLNHFELLYQNVLESWNFLQSDWFVLQNTFLWNPGQSGMPTVRKAKYLLLESPTKSVESGTYDVICQFCTVKCIVVESEVLEAQNCALSKFSLPMHSNDLLSKRTMKTCNEKSFQRLKFSGLEMVQRFTTGA